VPRCKNDTCGTVTITDAKRASQLAIQQLLNYRIKPATMPSRVAAIQRIESGTGLLLMACPVVFVPAAI
jgi:hypothetical protein